METRTRSQSLSQRGHLALIMTSHPPWPIGGPAARNTTQYNATRRNPAFVCSAMEPGGREEEAAAAQAWTWGGL